MKAVLQDEFGDETTLHVGTTDIPVPQDGEVLIRVCCTALNRMDLSQCRGLYPVPQGASKILGVEVSGFIHSIGPNCSSRFQVGDRCMALLQGGGYAEYAVAYETSTLHAPASLDMKILTSIPEQWMTAYQLLFMVGHLQAGETVLLHAAASGVGQAAIQLATRAGANCFATCRSDDKTACCLEMGARAAFNISNGPIFTDLLKSHNNGQLADLILDPVGGGPTANENMNALAVDGRWIFYGTMGGKGINDDSLAGKILAKRASLIGSTLRSRPQEYKSKLAVALEREVMPQIVSGEYKILIDSIYPMTTEGVQQAHRRMGSNENIGKIVLVVSEE